MSHLKNRVWRFFVFCAGASHESLVKGGKLECIKYAGIGAIILLTALFAVLSGGYALFTIFQSDSLAILLGILWGALIFSLDRFIVSSMRKSGGLGRELLQALPRIVLAVVIAISLSRPLELRLFEREISEQLNKRYETERLSIQESNDRLIHSIDANFQLKSENADIQPVVSDARIQINKNEDRILQLRREREKALNDYMRACDTTLGGGEGPACIAKKAYYEKLDAEFEVELARLNASNRRIEESLTQRQQQHLADQNKWGNEADKLKETASKENERRLNALEKHHSTSFLARNRALWDISMKDSGVMWVSFFFTLLFLIVEIAPVFVKLVSQRGEYDVIHETQREKAEHSLMMDRWERELLEYQKVQELMTLKSVIDASIPDAQQQLVGIIKESGDLHKYAEKLLNTFRKLIEQGIDQDLLHSDRRSITESSRVSGKKEVRKIDWLLLGSVSATAIVLALALVIVARGEDATAQMAIILSGGTLFLAILKSVRQSIAGANIDGVQYDA
jgi:hypothetical protein